MLQNSFVEDVQITTNVHQCQILNEIFKKIFDKCSIWWMEVHT